MKTTVPTNCCNCGAIMEYSKQDYGSMYKCSYCGTEHHIDLLGRIEEYKVKLMWQGHLIEAWLQEIEMQPIYEEFYSCDGHRTRIMSSPMLTLTLSGQIVDKRD